MQDAANILGSIVPKAADRNKFARLIEPGRTVQTLDGHSYRVASKVVGPDGIAAFKLADLQGKPVPTPANFYPLSPAVAKFAAWLRLVVAYRADFDAYVKEAIRKAGLPVDPKYNWAKWFQHSFVPKLSTKDETIQDEAVHDTIVKVLYEENLLANWKKLIKRFPAQTREKPLAEQITDLIKKRFLWEVSKANREIAEQIHLPKNTFEQQVNELIRKQKKRKKEITREQAEEIIRKKFVSPTEVVPMMFKTKPGVGVEGERSYLDLPEYATGVGAYTKAEADLDVAKFRDGFEKWLMKKYEPKAAGNYLVLFDIVWHYLREQGDRPPRRAIVPEWEERTGLSVDSLKQYITRFSDLVTQYKRLHYGDEAVHPLIDVIQQVTQERQEREKPRYQKREPAMASLEIAAREHKEASTGAECAIVEWKLGEWYYVLEDSNAPKNAWDWREYATAYGPFKSKDEALEHLDRYHANPGGYSVDAYRERKPSPVMEKLIAEAPENTKALDSSRLRNPFYRGRWGSIKLGMLVRGDQLNEDQRNIVLNRFIYRWTRENPSRTQVYECAQCDINEPFVSEHGSEGHSHPTIPLQSDEQWLAEHAFHFTKDGTRLLPRRYAVPEYMAPKPEPDPVLAMDKTAYDPGELVYLYRAALLCEECGEKAKAQLDEEGKKPADLSDETTWDSDHYPKGPFPDGGGQADSPQHCDMCGKFLENPLTNYGYEYLREMVNEWRQAEEGEEIRGDDEIMKEWVDFYPEAFELEYATKGEVERATEGLEGEATKEYDTRFLKRLGIKGSRKRSAERLKCCGGWHGRHRIDCPVHSQKMEETLKLLQSLPKRADEFEIVRGPEQYGTEPPKRPSMVSPEKTEVLRGPLALDPMKPEQWERPSETEPETAEIMRGPEAYDIKLKQGADEKKVRDPKYRFEDRVKNLMKKKNLSREEAEEVVTNVIMTKEAAVGHPSEAAANLPGAGQYVKPDLRVLLAEDWFIWAVDEKTGTIYRYNTELWPEWLDADPNYPNDPSVSVVAMIPYAKRYSPDIEKADDGTPMTLEEFNAALMPPPEKQAAIDHLFYEGIRPQVTPGDTGRVPHGRATEKRTGAEESETMTKTKALTTEAAPDEAPGPHSPNAPATAPRHPGMRPTVTAPKSAAAPAVAPTPPTPAVSTAPAKPGGGVMPFAIEMPEEEKPMKRTVPSELPNKRLHLQGKLAVPAPIEQFILSKGFMPTGLVDKWEPDATVYQKSEWRLVAAPDGRWVLLFGKNPEAHGADWGSFKMLMSETFPDVTFHEASSSYFQGLADVSKEANDIPYPEHPDPAEAKRRAENERAAMEWLRQKRLEQRPIARLGMRVSGGLEPGDEAEGYQCAVCGTQNFTRVNGRLVCLTCHPPNAPKLSVDRKKLFAARKKRAEAAAPKELSRKELAAMFPGYKITVRRVDFTDLARGSANFLTVKDSAGNKINGRGMYDQDWLDKYNDVFDKLNGLKGQYVYQGLPLIADS